MAQVLPHVTFQKYSTWWQLAVFQTVQTHASGLIMTHIHQGFEDKRVADSALFLGILQYIADPEERDPPDSVRRVHFLQLLSLTLRYNA